MSLFWITTEPVLEQCVSELSAAGSRRSRNRSKGQLLVKNSKATTLQFDSDFDFETANAQFKDDLTKEVVGRFTSKDICHSASADTI